MVCCQERGPNLDKTNIIKFVTNNLPHHALSVSYNGKYIEELVDTKFLCLQIDNNHIYKLIPNVSGACYVVRSVFHVSNTDALKSVCFAYFHSVMKYEVIFGGNSPNRKKIFTSQNKIFR
jgi:hypothetical protein